MKRPSLWLGVCLVVVPLVLSVMPGPPTHGFGYIFFLHPLFEFWRRPERRRRLLLYGLALGLNLLAYPAPDLGFLGFTLLLPWFAAREIEDGTSWWRTAAYFGFLRAFAGFLWLGRVHYTGWAATCLASGFVFAFIFEAWLRFGRLLPWALRVACAWASFEVLHSWLLGGLPMHELAHTQYRFSAWIQIADVAGALGVSFLMALIQGAAWQAWRERRFRALVTALALSAGVLVYGGLRAAHEAAPGPAVLLVQTAFADDVKSEEVLDLATLDQTLLRLTDAGLRENGDARLVVWPETMFPDLYVEDQPRESSTFHALLDRNARIYSLPFAYGVNSYTTMEKMQRLRGHNSAILVDVEGAIRGIYRKQRLVPMGELFLPRLFLPESWANAIIARLMSMGYPLQCDLEAGDSFVTMDAGPGLRFAPLICFEGLYARDARRALSSDRPDFLLHFANHGWFGDSWLQQQVLASLVFRAVENRTPLLSCANAGMSCGIGPDGRFLAGPLGVMEEGSLCVRIPPRWEPPPYRRGGAWILPPGLALAAGATFLAFCRDRNGGRLRM